MQTTWDITKDVAGGFMSSYALCSLKVEEAKERSNEEHFWATLSQGILCGFATEQALRLGDLPFEARILYSSTVALTVLVNGALAFQDNHFATVIYEHIGAVAIIAALATDIFTCFNGFPVYGATALIFFTFTLIEQYGYFPSEGHKYLHSSNFALTNGCRLVLGTPIDQCTAVAAVCYQAYQLLK